MECFNCGQAGHLSWQCQWSAELEGKLHAQFTRCGACRAVIYTWEKDLPCEAHRVAGAWREYYHSDQFVTDCAEVRARVEDSRSEFRRAHGMPSRTETELRAVAARQVAESRELRAASPLGDDISAPIPDTT